MLQAWDQRSQVGCRWVSSPAGPRVSSTGTILITEGGISENYGGQRTTVTSSEGHQTQTCIPENAQANTYTQNSPDPIFIEPLQNSEHTCLWSFLLTKIVKLYVCVCVCTVCVRMHTYSASRGNALHPSQQALSAPDAGSLCKYPPPTPPHRPLAQMCTKTPVSPWSHVSTHSSPLPPNSQWSREDGLRHHIPIKAEIVDQTASPLMWGGDQGLTRTLPVSVWADIITPAQSFTEVIQPTSAATVSSFSSTGLRVPSAWLEPLLIFWASWQQREQGLRRGHQEDLKNIFYPKELKPDGPLMRWNWFEGTEVRKKGWIMALIVFFNLF